MNGKFMVLVDIGSTFTKATAVDLGQRRIAAQASAPTTVDDVSRGLRHALEGLKLDPGELSQARKLACSSAAGGLRMVAIGLVQDLTAKAARLAALGAGARVLNTYSFQLTEADREEIAALQPDIILLAGGTDGGNSENILHNARVLATLPQPVPVVIAGNRSVAKEVAACFPQGFSTYIAPNVMPQIGKLQVDPAREVIRRVFMEKIIYAKGLDKAGRVIDGIFMPTPAAVLRAGQLLSEGTGTRKGWGDLIIVDVGGATTDVHSLGTGLPTRAGVVVRGLPEPYAKRTVEGDLGVRVSVLSLLEAVGVEAVAQAAGWPQEEAAQRAQRLHDQPELLPESGEEAVFDQALARLAVQHALSRHVGRLSELYTPAGLIWVQEGKDLSQVETVIGTGGVVVNSADPLAVLEGAAKQADAPLELRPEKPEFYLDGNYILAAMGLLAQEDPEAAFEILSTSLECHKLARREQ
ncbi:MAG TPA: methylaspartate mutase accessory protein GlmL [Limnochordia bacterium]|nr:methylaspartate mutase accessory protein GlmL [Limnochordia bacterium]